MSTYKFGTTYGLTRDEIIERMMGMMGMMGMIDYEKFIRCDFDYSRYHWVIGGAVAAIIKVDTLVRLPYAVKLQTMNDRMKKQLANSAYGIACVAATEKNFTQNPTSILGIEVKTIEWNPEKVSSISLIINEDEPKLRRVNYTDYFSKRYPIGRAAIVPEKVIFNDPATIVFWRDGTKTVVKAKDEAFDPEKGLAMAYAKKASGNTGSYYNEFKKWIPKETEDEANLSRLSTILDNRSKRTHKKKEETKQKKCIDCKYWKLGVMQEPCRSCIGEDSKVYWVKADE